MDYYNITLIFLIIGITCLNTGDGCQVSRHSDRVGTPSGRLRAAVLQAREQSHDNVVDLSSVAPSIPKQPSNVNIVRPRTGTTVTFTCTSKAIIQNATGNSGDFVVWRHKDILIYTNGTPPTTSTSNFYSFSKVGNNHLLFIHNISYDAGGSVQCLEHCMENATTTLCLRKDYQIRPKLNVEEAFLDTMQNVSTAYWEFYFACKPRILVVGEDPFVAWRYDGLFVAASEQHFLADLIATRSVPPQPAPQGVLKVEIHAFKCYHAVKNPHCQHTIKVTTSQAVTPLATSVECWVQPDRSIQEYFVQTAYVAFR